MTVGDAAPSKFKHRDGEGWRNYDVAVPAELRGKREPVTVDVWAKGAKDRGFCWSALSIAR